MATRIPLSLRGGGPSQRSSYHLFFTANRHLALTRTRTLTTSSSLLAKANKSKSKSETLSEQLQASKPSSSFPAHQPSFSPSAPKGNANEAQDLGKLLQERKWPLLLSGLTAFIISAYISMVVVSLIKGPDPCHIHVDPATGELPVTGRPRELDSLTNNPAVTDWVLREKAEEFDRGLNMAERVMGIRLLRKWLGTRVKGHVLEVAVGTGRNLQFYDWTEVVKGPPATTGRELTAEEKKEEEKKEKERIRAVLDRGEKQGNKDWVERIKLPGSLEGEMLTFTGVDISEGMMGVARQRLRENVPEGKKVVPKGKRLGSARQGGEGETSIGQGKRGEEQEVLLSALEDRIRLVRADAEAKLPEAPAYPARFEGEDVKKYDTVVQTFGLCSVNDPLALLKNMADVVKPDTGRIILLEHGKGWSDWINEKLDLWAPQHFTRYGCWWNRDIERLVKEAEKKVPGLEVVEIERPGWFQAGTTVLVQLKVKSQGN